MDGGHRWHVAGGGAGALDKTIINRIMHRFRPIAPKPVAESSSSGGISPESKNVHFTSKRVKRKYIRVAKNNSNSRRKINRSSKDEPKAGLDADDSAIVTLQLLPEKTDGGDFSGTGSWCRIDPTVANNPDLPMWMNMNPMKNLNRSAGNEVFLARPDRTAVVVPSVSVVESWVTVESVTDTCMDVRGLGRTDVEKLKSLEKDTCPGFVSDGSNRVKWVNEAYKNMVSQGQQSPEMRVWLVQRAELPCDAYRAFTCRVRLQYTWQKEKCSKMVPCDVWRMEYCCLAWRLDIKAALSLGL